jgi:hypothetical protein
MIIMGLEDLNRRAEKTFDGIKRRKGFTSRIIEEAAKSDSSIDQNKLQKMLEMPPKRVEVEDYVKHYDAKFSSAEVSPMAFIDSLELPANLSISIACLIEYGKKKNKKSLKDAMGYIMKEIENG